MKKAFFIALAAALTLLFAGTVFAQKFELSDTDYLGRVQKYIVWGKDVSKKMSVQLDEARKEQNMMKIECIEKRLIDIQNLLAQTQAGYKKMQDFSFGKQIFALRREFTLADQKRQVMEQLVRLVNECLGKTFHDGFTESVEEFFGWYDDEDPTVGEWEDYWPDPLPPVYDPLPASLVEDE